MSAAVTGRLLCDATVPVNFCTAGLPSARAMAAHLGGSVHVVDEVFDELTRLAETLVPLKIFLTSWPPSEPLRLEQGLRLDVASVVTVRATVHPNEDRGETATVLYAESRRELAGEGFEILTDDQWGRKLARDRGLQCRNTPQLVVEMVCASRLTYKDGQRVWQQCFTNQRKWTEFHGAVERSCPGKLPPPRAAKG